MFNELIMKSNETSIPHAINKKIITALSTINSPESPADMQYPIVKLPTIRV